MVNQNVKEWFDRGNEQYGKGDFEGAIVSYDQAIEIKPDFHEAWSNRTYARLRNAAILAVKIPPRWRRYR